MGDDLYDNNLFVVTDEPDPVEEARAAGTAIARARHEVKRRVGEFLADAVDDEELIQRMSYPDVDTVIDEATERHLGSVSDGKAKLARSLVREVHAKWEKASAECADCKACHKAGKGCSCGKGCKCSCSKKKSQWDARTATGAQESTCLHCQRPIVYDQNDGWVDPEATGDDSVWRETCDAHDTFRAEHEPKTGSRLDPKAGADTQHKYNGIGMANDDPRRSGMFRHDVLGAGENRWTANGVAYPTHEDAAAAGKDLYSRWTGMAKGRVVPADHPFNETYDEEKHRHQIVVGRKQGARESFAVCPTCEGRGSHVNPAIDSQGISREQFDEDPDFEEAYFRGDYDQACNECGGQRVVPQCKDPGCAKPAEFAHGMGDRREKGQYGNKHFDACYDHLDPDDKEDLDDHFQGEAESASERMMFGGSKKARDENDEALECIDDHKGNCGGAIENRMSLSGTGTPIPRCDKHWGDRLDEQDRINERYPQHAPSDFDPGYAGERWDEDY